MATNAMTSFNSLPDEIILKIIAMAAREWDDPTFKYDHDHLVDDLCKVSVRFERLARDSSLWKDHVWITIPGNDFRKLDFVIQECLNNGTEKLYIWASGDPSLPNRYLTDLAMFPNLKTVYLGFGGIQSEENIPAPWIKKKVLHSNPRLENK